MNLKGNFKKALSLLLCLTFCVQTLMFGSAVVSAENEAIFSEYFNYSDKLENGADFPIGNAEFNGWSIKNGIEAKYYSAEENEEGRGYLDIKATSGTLSLFGKILPKSYNKQVVIEFHAKLPTESKFEFFTRKASTLQGGSASTRVTINADGTLASAKANVELDRKQWYQFTIGVDYVAKKYSVKIVDDENMVIYSAKNGMRDLYNDAETSMREFEFCLANGGRMLLDNVNVYVPEVNGVDIFGGVEGVEIPLADTKTTEAFYPSYMNKEAEVPIYMPKENILLELLDAQKNPMPADSGYVLNDDYSITVSSTAKPQTLILKLTDKTNPDYVAYRELMTYKEGEILGLIKKVDYQEGFSVGDVIEPTEVNGTGVAKKEVVVDPENEKNNIAQIILDSAKATDVKYKTALDAPAKADETETIIIQQKIKFSDVKPNEEEAQAYYQLGLNYGDYYQPLFKAYHPKSAQAFKFQMITDRDDNQGAVRFNGSPFAANVWYNVKVEVDTNRGWYNLYIQDATTKEMKFKSVSRKLPRFTIVDRPALGQPIDYVSGIFGVTEAYIGSSVDAETPVYYTDDLIISKSAPIKTFDWKYPLEELKILKNVAPIFSDHMVLQREKTVPVWGQVEGANKPVTVKFLDQVKTTTTDAEGNWRVNLDPLTASFTPAEMTIDVDGYVETLTDILVGEVWIGSGQSNMELAVKSKWGESTPGAVEFVGEGNYPNIRISSGNRDQLTTFNNSWIRINEDNIYSMPSIMMTMAIRLQEQLNVPVGLIVRGVASSQSLSWVDEDIVREKYGKVGSTTGVNFNRYIRWVAPYAVRGVMWDQGENLTGVSGVSIDDSFVTLIESWRDLWEDQTLPFIYMEKPSKFPKDMVDKMISKTDLTYMAPTKDISDNGLNHPLKKEIYGERFFLQAIGNIYKDTTYNMPFILQNGKALQSNSVDVNVSKGQITLILPIKEGSTDNINARVVLAKYKEVDGKKQLIDVQTTREMFINTGKYSFVSIPYTVPTEENYTISAFVFDNFDNIVPVSVQKGELSN